MGAHGRDEMLQVHEALADLYAAKKISGQIGAKIAFESVPDYLARLDRREIQGKVVVDIKKASPEGLA